MVRSMCLRHQAAWETTAGKMHAYQEKAVDRVDKEHHFRRDWVNDHTEKALYLHEKPFTGGTMKPTK